MTVLIDTCVWIEFVNRHGFAHTKNIQTLLRNDEVVTCQPIRAEILSGKLNAKLRNTLIEMFEGIPFVDLDWNNGMTWNSLIRIAEDCRVHGNPTPGLIDRMILLCARESAAKIWTYDKKLDKLSHLMHLHYEP